MALVTLAEAKAGLNKLSALDDAEIQGYIDGASEAIQSITGPIASIPRTEKHDGGDSVVMLRVRPVLAITSVTEYRGSGAGTVLAEHTPGSTVDGYLLDSDIGQLIRCTATGYPRAFWPGPMNVVVVFNAGYASTPPTVKQATLLLIEHLWRTTQNRGGSARPQPGASSADSPLTAHALPWVVEELIAPYLKAPEIG